MAKAGRCSPKVERSTCAARQSSTLRSMRPRPPSWPAGSPCSVDPARLQILSILAAAPFGEVCVCEFVEPLGKSQPTVSYHLKLLGDAGLGRRRPAGQVGVVLTEPRPSASAAGRHRGLKRSERSRFREPPRMAALHSESWQVPSFQDGNSANRESATVASTYLSMAGPCCFASAPRRPP